MHHSLKPLFLLFILTISSCAKEETTEEPIEEVSDYQLQYVQSIGIPVSNPQGIASDQNNLWILSGEFNGDTHELTLYDPVNYTILNQFTYTNLIEVLGTGVFGITWDGTNVWISVAGMTNKLVKVDPGTGDILQVWSSPSMASPDLEWDGEKIWLTSANGYSYTIDPISGGSELFINELEDHGAGIAFRNGEMWVVGQFDNDIHVFNSTNGKYHGVIKNAINTNDGALCFHNNQLLSLSTSGIAVYNVIE